jgi:predicted ArsR family transcriptional regulator
MELQPFHVFDIALDKTDDEILVTVAKLDSIEIKDLADKLQLDEDELRARLTMLQYYEILNEDYTISEVGITFHKYRLNNPRKEEEYFDPPWKSMAELTSTIAATQSFAEALVVVSEEEKLPWEVDENELIDIKERAKDKTSFAQLLSKEMKGDSEDDESQKEKKKNEDEESES